AQERSHAQVGPLHLLDALLADGEGLAPRLITKAGGSVEAIRADLARGLSQVSTQSPAPEQIGFSHDVAKALQAAHKDRERRKDSHLAVEHLVLALAEDRRLAQALKAGGVDAKALAKAVEEVRQGRSVTSDQAENA